MAASKQRDRRRKRQLRSFSDVARAIAADAVTLQKDLDRRFERESAVYWAGVGAIGEIPEVIAALAPPRLVAREHSVEVSLRASESKQVGLALGLQTVGRRYDVWSRQREETELRDHRVRLEIVQTPLDEKLSRVTEKDET